MTPIALALGIGLLALTVALLCPVAVAMVVLLVYETVRDPGQRPKYLPTKPRRKY